MWHAPLNEGRGEDPVKTRDQVLELGVARLRSTKDGEKTPSKPGCWLSAGGSPYSLNEGRGEDPVKTRRRFSSCASTPSRSTKDGEKTPSKPLMSIFSRRSPALPAQRRTGRRPRQNPVCHDEWQTGHLLPRATLLSSL